MLRAARPAAGPHRTARDRGARSQRSGSSASTSSSHRRAEASLGMRQSPRGDSVTEPTFGPSGRQLRLNCWAKNRR